MEEDLELNSESDNRSKSHSQSVRKNIPIKLKSSTTSGKTRGRPRKTVKAEPNQESHHGEQTRTDDDILREPPIFKSTNYQADPMHQSKRLKWDHNVRLIGEKVVDPLIHSCEKCTLPILIYGRMIPCKHVFCHDCAKKMDKICPRCDEEVQRIEQSALGTVFICTHGGSKHAFNGCRRTYLSQRDLQAHINHRHLRTSSSESHSKSSSHHHSTPAYTESHAKPAPHHPPPSSMYGSSPHLSMDHNIATAPVSRSMAVDPAVYRPMEGIPNRPPPQLPAHMQPHPQMMSQAPPPIPHSQPPPHIPRSQHGGIATTIESYQTSAVAGLTGSGRTNLITVPIQDEQGYGRRDPGGMSVYTSRPPPTVMQPSPYAQTPYTQAPMPAPHQPYPSSSLAAPHQVASYPQQPLGVGVTPYTPAPVGQQAGMPPHPASLAQPHPASSIAMQRPVMSAPPPGSHQGIPTGPPPHMVMPQSLQHQPQQFASPSSHRPYDDPHGGGTSFPQTGSPQVQWNVPPQQRPRMAAPPRSQAEPGQYNQYF